MCGIESLLLGGLAAAGGAGAALLAPKPDYSGALAASAQSTNAALAALDEQKRSLEKATALTMPAADSESARLAADAQRRKAASRRSTTVAGELAPANVATKLLFGE